MKFLHGRKGLVLWLNIGIVLLLCAYVTFFSIDMRRSSITAAQQDVVEQVDELQRSTTAYMDSACRSVRDWVSYINKHPGTATETLHMLGDLNSDDRIMVHLADTINLEAISSQARTNTPGDYTIDYNRYYDLSLELYRIAREAEPNRVSVTSAFTNYINGEQSIAFVSWVQLLDSDGGLKPMLLMRVEPIKLLMEYWEQQSSNSDIQISLISSTGAYLYRAPLFKNTNFYEFLRTYNGLTYGEADDISRMVTDSEQGGGMIYNNAQGEPTLFAYSGKSYNNWLLVGAIPCSALPQAGIQWSLLVVTVLSFLLLIAVDMAYLSSLNRQLRESMKDLEHANAAKTQFLSTISHDIRSPMSTILGMTAIAQRNLDNRARVEDCLQKLSQAGNHLLMMINDVLDISRVESGKFDLRPEDFMLGEEFEGLVNIIYPQARLKNLKMDIQLENMLHEELYADKLRLNQIALNLLTNAIRNTPEGGRIDVLLRQEPGKDERHVKQIFQVRDNGVGMSEEYQKTLFEPYAQRRGGRVGRGDESRLSMALTRQMVQLLGGTIQVQSYPGEGSTFTVTLNLHLSRAPRQRTLPAPEQRVLLLASPNMQQQLNKLLFSMGLYGVTATDAEDALEKLKQGERVMALLVDHDPPAQDAGQIMQQLNASGQTLPPIVIAAYVPLELEQFAAQADFLAKPVFRSALARMLVKLQDRDQQTPEAQTQIAQLRDARLLVAEDSDLSWEIFQDQLGMYGIQAERVADGKACVEALTQHPNGYYQMILMDLQMPQMNGFEATQAIRALPNKEKAFIPIIAMMTEIYTEDIAASKAAGMNDYMEKPVNARILAGILEKYGKR